VHNRITYGILDDRIIKHRGGMKEQRLKEEMHEARSKVALMVSVGAMRHALAHDVRHPEFDDIPVLAREGMYHLLVEVAESLRIVQGAFFSESGDEQEELDAGPKNVSPLR
jgi:hypothetical protein